MDRRAPCPSRRRLLRGLATVAAASGAVALAGCAVSDASQATRRALLRHASFRGIEAKAMVGRSIDEAIAKYGRAVRVVSVPADDARRFGDVTMGGKDLYAFERDRTDYTIDVARGTEVGQSSVGPVQVQRYERVNRTAVCTLGFIVEPSSRRILAYDLQGNCL